MYNFTLLPPTLLPLLMGENLQNQNNINLQKFYVLIALICKKTLSSVITFYNFLRYAVRLPVFLVYKIAEFHPQNLHIFYFFSRNA